MRGAGVCGIGVGSLGSYAVGIEPGLMLDVTNYTLTPPGWPANLPLKIAVIADIHACEPWMPVSRIQTICDIANGLDPDLTVILGDFNGGHNYVTAPVFPHQWAEALSTLKAPLGVHAILGNHDWRHGAIPSLRGNNVDAIKVALRQANINLMENEALRLTSRGKPFWLLGLGDQIAYRVSRGVYRGADDLGQTLGRVTDDAPVLLLAHEPFIFNQVPKRVSLTLCGHTHGGQVDLPIIGSPFARRRFGAKHIYGHVIENGRHMVISAGLGTSIAPVRFGRPPEIVSIMLAPPMVA
jgi:predicted MPP superfamily phosphohydrolase